MQTIYRSGRWYVIVLPGAVVALEPSVSANVVTLLWERMPQQTTLATAIDILASDTGGDFAALPSFVAAVAEEAGVRIALRGEVTARVGSVTGSEEFSGAEVTTWNERFVSHASRVHLALEQVQDEAALPVHGGVVRAAEVDAELEFVGEATTISAPGEVPRRGDPDPSPAEPADVPVVSEPADVPVVSEVTMTPTEVTLAPSTEDVDQLWGATVHSAPEPPPAPVSEPGILSEGDHDGATIASSQLRALRQQSPSEQDAPTALLPVTPGSTGLIRVSTGQVVTLDRTVIIGRRPRSTRASGANLPHLIAVDSPQQDISRSHLEIRPEGDTVVVIDMHTTNGSTLLRPGADPIRLHPGEQTLVLSGDVVDLGDGVKVAFEDLP